MCYIVHFNVSNLKRVKDKKNHLAEMMKDGNALKYKLFLTF